MTQGGEEGGGCDRRKGRRVVVVTGGREEGGGCDRGRGGGWWL